MAKKFSLAIAKEDLEKIDAQAKFEGISRNKLIMKAIAYGIANNIKKTVPDSYKPKDTKTITVTCSDAEREQIDKFIQQHKIIKSRWVVGLLLDKQPADYLELKQYGEDLGYQLSDRDIEQIKDNYSVFLEINSPKVRHAAVEQYLLILNK